MHTASRAILTVAVAVSAASAGLVASPVSPAAAADGYRWVSAVDGDTVELPNGRSVRLLGYDTPEVGQCGYDEAVARMAALTKGQVKLVNRSGTDKYGRILAYIKTRNGRDIGTVMLRRGLAVARYDSLDGYPRHPKQKLYRSLDSTNGEIVCPEPAPEPTPDPTPTFVAPVDPPVTPPVTVYYANCDAVRAAGAAPIYVGQPGYGRHLDRDGDGVGCED
jgi:endonuclease YncB( thermonuclease family)